MAQTQFSLRTLLAAIAAVGIGAALWTADLSMALLRVTLVLAAMGTGIALGVIASFRSCRRAVGFDRGAALGCLFTLLVSLMCGHLLAGRAEGWLRTTIGVPLGLGVGCFAGAYTANTIVGSFGVLIAKTWTGFR